jgi:hypothetical protein
MSAPIRHTNHGGYTPHPRDAERFATTRRLLAGQSPAVPSVADHRYAAAIVREQPRLLVDLRGDPVVW